MIFPAQIHCLIVLSKGNVGENVIAALLVAKNGWWLSLSILTGQIQYFGWQCFDVHSIKRQPLFDQQHPKCNPPPILCHHKTYSMILYVSDVLLARCQKAYWSWEHGFWLRISSLLARGYILYRRMLSLLCWIPFFDTSQITNNCPNTLNTCGEYLNGAG